MRPTDFVDMQRLYNTMLDVVSVEFGIGRAVLESHRHGPERFYTRIRCALYTFLSDRVGMNAAEIHRVAGGGPSFSSHVRRLRIRGRKALEARDDEVVLRCYGVLESVYAHYVRGLERLERVGLKDQWRI